MNLIKRDTPRDIKFTKNINPYAYGSVIVEFGNTKIHVTASVEENVPPWLKGTGKGWITAEYSMLPMSTHTRIKRDRKGISGRAQEIQRLIGRSLRAAVDLNKIPDISITIDCDVLVADGGTRTAAISGGYVALAIAIDRLKNEGKIKINPINNVVAAISVGVDKDGKILSDLNYEEDSSCDTDMNVVMTDDGRFIEIQGTAEGNPFSRESLSMLLDVASKSLGMVIEKQKIVINS